jgi:hypothetical protein
LNGRCTGARYGLNVMKKKKKKKKRRRKEKKIFSRSAVQPRLLGFPSRVPVTIPTETPRLHDKNNLIKSANYYSPFSLTS